MTGEILAAELVGAHPGGAAHILVLGVVAVIALVVFGLIRWRERRARVERQSASDDLSAESRRSTEEK